MKVRKWTVLSAFFAALLALSLYGSYVFNQAPSTRSRSVVDLIYIQSVDYSYTALVKPSVIYGNRTEISTGEPLYIKLLEELNITLQYKLTENPNRVNMTRTKVEYETSAAVSGTDWIKTYRLGSKTSTGTSFNDTYSLDIKDIQEIVETIGEETGSRVYAYRYEIRPEIALEASAAGKRIEETFTPTLTLKFEGAKIEFEGLSNRKDGSVSHIEREPATWSLLGWTVTVSSMRVVSTTGSICLAALLSASIYVSFKERASRPFLERLSGDVRDKIVEVSELPKRMAGAKIKVRSLEDLAKVSEETFKPIIHHGDTFYVLDADFRYEFRMEPEEDEQPITEEDAELSVGTTD